MSEFKGTKGEWKINKYNNVTSKYDLPIAVIYDGSTAHNSFKESDIDTCKANAKLISCSPKLLEALKEMVAFAEFHGYTQSTEINNARQLIQKATTL